MARRIPDNYLNFYYIYPVIDRSITYQNFYLSKEVSAKKGIGQEKKRVNYTYDGLNRITSAIDNTGHYNLTSVSYDKNGNITALNRKGNIVQNPTQASHFGVMDNLKYYYQSNSNKLIKVSDLSNKPYGFKDGTNSGNDYSYDQNGNMIEDMNKGIIGIGYNYLNLPVAIELANGTAEISYIYDAIGRKLQKIVDDDGAITTTQYANNGAVYENNVLQFIPTAEGYVTPNASGSFDYVYQYKDHLGNIRLSYADSNHDGLISGVTSQLFYDDLENSSGWDSNGALYGSSATIDSEHAISGTTAAKLTLSGAGDLYAHSNEWIPINNTGATDYIFSGWIYLASPSSAYARILFFMNEDNETAYFTQIADGGKVYTKNQWVYVEKRVTVPANIDKINLRLDVYTGYSSGASAWFDNLSIRKVNSTNEIIEENNYYPFGLKHKGYNNVINGQEDKYHTYNGKEWNESLTLNIYEMDWRQYAPAIGRFMSIDPITHWEKSPYSAFENNPIYFSDPSGADVIITEGGNNIKFTGDDAKEAFLILTGNNNTSSDEDKDEGKDNDENKYEDPLSSENNKTKASDPKEDIKKHEQNEKTIRRNSIIAEVLSRLTTKGQLKSTLGMVIEEWQRSTNEIITPNERDEILSDIDDALTVLGIGITTRYPQVKIAATILSTSLAVQNIYLQEMNRNVLEPRIKRDSPVYYQENIDPSYHLGGRFGGGGAGGSWKKYNN